MSGDVVAHHPPLELAYTDCEVEIVPPALVSSGGGCVFVWGVIIVSHAKQLLVHEVFIPDCPGCQASARGNTHFKQVLYARWSRA